MDTTERKVFQYIFFLTALCVVFNFDARVAIAETIPAQPSQLILSYVSTTNILTFTDAPLTVNEDGFRIKRSINGGPYILLTTLAANQTNYNDTDNVTPGNQYCYRVTAFNIAGESPYVEKCIIDTMTPWNLSANYLSTDNRMDLVWQDYSNGVNSFLVYRNVNGAGYSRASTRNPGELFYNDLAVAPGNTYCYKIQSTNGVSFSFFSNEICKTAEDARPIGEKAADLAKLVINDPYLGDGSTWGGKGWDSTVSQYVAPDTIGSGYSFWNNAGHPPMGVVFGAGLDCSGLVEWAYNRSFDPQKSLTHNAIRWDSANGQYLHNSTPITEADLKQGDLLFFGSGSKSDPSISHVAMYTGNYERNGEVFDVVEARSPALGIVPSHKLVREQDPGFLTLGLAAVRRVVLGPPIGGSIQAGSPIDLVITDPEGFTITATTSIQTSEELLREVPGQLYYSESKLGSDGRPESIVYWPVQKTGDYLVKVSPQVGVSPLATYSLTFQSGSTTIPLTQNMPMSQIPAQGYGITTSASGIITSFIPVAIDIRPGKNPNNVNLRSGGTVLVAILGSATLNIRDINLGSITLANAPVSRQNNAQLMLSYKDLNKDGFPDALVRFPIQSLNLTSSSTQANLMGQLVNGTVIKGSDSVRIVSTRENEDDDDKDAND